MRDFGDDVFAGTARYYALYRPKYPDQIFNDIHEYFKLDGKGKLLDLGCGTGELAIPLAKYFDQVIALDPDEDMLKEGIRKAKNQNVNNIEWQRGSSKTLTGVKGSFRLVVMGQSFHWMDGEAVLRQLYDLLEDGGGVVIVGTTPTDQNKETTEKDKLVKGLIAKYLGSQRRAGSHIYVPTGADWEKMLFPKSAFGRFEKQEYIIQSSRNIDQVIGNLFSMSFASKKLLGDKAESFEDELRRALKGHSKDRKFNERTTFSLYFLSK